MALRDFWGNPILQEEHFQLYSAMSCNDHPRENGSGAPDSPKRRRQKQSSVPFRSLRLSLSFSLFLSYRKYISIYLCTVALQFPYCFYIQSLESVSLPECLQISVVAKYTEKNALKMLGLSSSFTVGTSTIEKVKKVLVSSEKKACWLGFLLPFKSSCGRSPLQLGPQWFKMRDKRTTFESPVLVLLTWHRLPVDCYK